MSEINDLQNMPDAAAPAPQDKSLTLASPVDVARATAGLTLQEAVNLGEINPAQARRFGERMDQIFVALMRGAGAQWGPNGDLKLVYPEVQNPILAAVEERKREREAKLKALHNTTAMPQPPFIDAVTE